MNEKASIFQCSLAKKIHQAVRCGSDETIVIQDPPQPQEMQKLFRSLTPAELEQVPNLIIHATLQKNTAYPTLFLPLTIGCAVQGRLLIKKGKRQLILNEKNYRIMNQGEYVTEAREANSKALRISFNSQFANEVLSSLITSDDQLLDGARQNLTQKLYLFARTHPHDTLISPLLANIRNHIEKNMDPLLLEEILHRLLERVFLMHRRVTKEISRLPVIKKSTQLELYQRIHDAKEYIEDQLSTPLRLASIAQTAGLSKHHFLRLFKSLIGETPYRYIQRRRLEEFRQLILSDPISITEACYDVGFSDLSECSRLFKKYYGLSPRKFCQNNSNKIF